MVAKTIFHQKSWRRWVKKDGILHRCASHIDQRVLLARSHRPFFLDREQSQELLEYPKKLVLIAPDISVSREIAGG